MELKEIFSHEDPHLYRALAVTHQRYTELRGRFEGFLRQFPPNKRGLFPDGTQFSVDTDIPLLIVQFCGKAYRFKFSMSERMGLVKCSVRSMSQNDNDKNEIEEVGRFTFNGEGVTNIIPPGQHAHPLSIDANGAAYGIVASFLIAGF